MCLGLCFFWAPVLFSLFPLEFGMAPYRLGMAYNSFIDEAWDRPAPTDIAQVDIGCVLTVNSGIECKGASSHCCTVHMQEALAIRQLTSTFPPASDGLSLPDDSNCITRAQATAKRTGDNTASPPLHYFVCFRGLPLVLSPPRPF